MFISLENSSVIDTSFVFFNEQSSAIYAVDQSYLLTGTFIGVSSFSSL